MSSVLSLLSPIPSRLRQTKWEEGSVVSGPPSKFSPFSTMQPFLKVWSLSCLWVPAPPGVAQALLNFDMPELRPRSLRACQSTLASLLPTLLTNLASPSRKSHPASKENLPNITPRRRRKPTRPSSPLETPCLTLSYRERSER